jgi:hypothetical protein
MSQSGQMRSVSPQTKGSQHRGAQQHKSAAKQVQSTQVMTRRVKGYSGDLQ